MIERFLSFFFLVRGKRPQKCSTKPISSIRRRRSSLHNKRMRGTLTQRAPTEHARRTRTWTRTPGFSRRRCLNERRGGGGGGGGRRRRRVHATTRTTNLDGDGNDGKKFAPKGSPRISCASLDKRLSKVSKRPDASRWRRRRTRRK